jgi:hypothetical protein
VTSATILLAASTFDEGFEMQESMEEEDDRIDLRCTNYNYYY